MMKSSSLQAMVIAFLLGATSFLGVASSVIAGEKVNWESINPSSKDSSTLIGIKECMECHADYINAFNRTKHAKAFKAGLGETNGISCEECHGPLGNHLEWDNKVGSPKAVSFKKIPAKVKSQICLQCHEQGLRMHWKGSPHEISGVTCTNCHYVMKKKSKRKLFIYDDSKNACFQCHRGEKAKLLRTSHHPLREGKMDCASCHNPHGGFGPSLMKKATVNETCTSCHQEKRGPYVWEHAPSRENCINCHEAHGSNFSRLLKRKAPYLCQQCHQRSGIPHGSVNTPLGGNNISSQFFGGKSCLNCHSKVHGSNHPSGAMFQR
jgi:DmsE family decaheme c-type cytochrome